MEKVYTIQEILDALRKVEEYHHAKWGGKKNNPNSNSADDYFSTTRRRLCSALNPEDYGTLIPRSRRILKDDD